MSKCFANGSIPVFLGGVGIEPPNRPGAQLIYCDIFYCEEPVVGFHFMGAPDDTIAHFIVEEKPETILFFNVAEVTEDPDKFEGEAGCTILFSSVFEKPEGEAASFFEVKDPAQETILFFNVGHITEEDLLAVFVNEDP